MTYRAYILERGGGKNKWKKKTHLNNKKTIKTGTWNNC